MIYDEAEYPHDHTRLPAVKQLLATLDWEVVCVFDACRWDAFEELCAPAEPVAAPGTQTPTWIADIWCDETLDWGDVTYVSANPMAVHLRELDTLPDARIEDHVGEYVPTYEMDDLFGEYRQVVLPDRLTEYAATCEPPMVVHFVQPHTPFIAPELGINLSFNVDDVVDLDVSTERYQEPVYGLWEAGHVSTALLRAAYRQNLRLVWRESERLREEFDRVLTTADHGELLGPETFGHVDEPADQLHVIPFHASWEVSRPDPAELGAAQSHDWVYDGSDQSEGRTTPSDENEESDRSAVEDQLGQLGYK